MSSNIWTACGRRTNCRRLRGSPWRCVESQHSTATAALVDSADEQHRLEALIDGVKPPIPPAARGKGLHYLLATPFRYPPLRHGSRFGRRSERGIWYGSEQPTTALAETAFYRFVFLDDTAADLATLETRHTLFRVIVDTPLGIDLTAPPFDRFRETLRHLNDCCATQRLGSDMRSDGVAAFRYLSARDPSGGVNVGVLDPAAFSSPPWPTTAQEWVCVTSRERITFLRRAGQARLPIRLDFPREAFLVDGYLPHPASS